MSNGSYPYAIVCANPKVVPTMLPVSLSVRSASTPLNLILQLIVDFSFTSSDQHFQDYWQTDV